jgi:hypothetical protein
MSSFHPTLEQHILSFTFFVLEERKGNGKGRGRNGMVQEWHGNGMKIVMVMNGNGKEWE